MPPINTSNVNYAGAANYAGGAAHTAAAGGPYANQGANTVNSVANGFQQFVQGGGQAMGGSSEGGSSGGGSIPPMPPYKSPIMEKAKSNASSAETNSTGEGRDSTGWKKTASIFDGGDEGGGDGGYEE